MSVAISMICIHTVILNLDMSSMILLYSVWYGYGFSIQSFLIRYVGGWILNVLYFKGLSQISKQAHPLVIMPSASLQL